MLLFRRPRVLSFIKGCLSAVVFRMHVRVVPCSMVLVVDVLVQCAETVL